VAQVAALLALRKTNLDRLLSRAPSTRAWLLGL